MLQVCIWNHSCPSAWRLACYASRAHWFYAHGNSLLHFVHEIVVSFIWLIVCRCTYHLKLSDMMMLMHFYYSSLSSIYSHINWIYLKIFLHVNLDYGDYPLVWLMVLCLWVQPYGFFNCSPAVDVPPNPCEMDSKDNESKDNGVSKPIQSGLVSKL